MRSYVKNKANEIKMSDVNMNNLTTIPTDKYSSQATLKIPPPMEDFAFPFS